METAVVALRVALSLGVVLALLWFLHRRITRGSSARLPPAAITVLGKQAIGQKASVVVVQAEGKRFVLGVTEHSITVLHGEEAPLAPAVSFAAALAESTAGDIADETRAAVLVRPRNRSQGPLAGSILSPATWRQAAAALGRGR